MNGNTESQPVNPGARRAARLGAVQALYQMDLGGIRTEEVIEEFQNHRLGREIEGDQYPEADVELFGEIVRGIVDGQADIDRMIEDKLASGWTMTRLDSTLRALLRCACYELLNRRDIPARTTINEYIEVAHAFFDDNEAKFVNGIADSIAREHRADEMKTN